MKLLDHAALAARAAEAHVTGCTSCRPGLRFPELCPEGQRQVAEASGGLVTPVPPATPRTAAGDVGAEAERAVPGPARLAALMRTRQHWRDHRLVSEGTLTQAEVRAALGWIEPADPPAVTYAPGRLDQLRQLVHVVTAGPSAFPDLTDEFLVGKARTAMPELLALVERLAARVEELEGRACRCYDPTAHVAGCVKAATRFNGRTLPAAVWYQDPDGDWWLPVAADARGCLVLQLDGDPGQAPAPLDVLEDQYGRLTATVYGAHLERRDLPEGTGPDAARRAVAVHVDNCCTCRTTGDRPDLCRTGQELTLAAATATEEHTAGAGE